MFSKNGETWRRIVAQALQFQFLLQHVQSESSVHTSFRMFNDREKLLCEYDASCYSKSLYKRPRERYIDYHVTFQLISRVFCILHIVRISYIERWLNVNFLYTQLLYSRKRKQCWQYFYQDLSSSNLAAQFNLWMNQNIQVPKTTWNIKIVSELFFMSVIIFTYLLDWSKLFYFCIH